MASATTEQTAKHNTTKKTATMEGNPTLEGIEVVMDTIAMRGYVTKIKALDPTLAGNIWQAYRATAKACQRLTQRVNMVRDVVDGAVDDLVTSRADSEGYKAAVEVLGQDMADKLAKVN